MKWLAFTLAAALVVSGCGLHDRRVAEGRAKADAEDDARCQSYGAKPGTDGYVNCRAQLGKPVARVNIEEAPRQSTYCIRTGYTVNCY